MAGVIAAFGIGTSSAWAADGQPSAGDVRQRLELKRSELDAAREHQKALKSEVSEINKERELLNAGLLEKAAQIQKSEGRLTELEGKLSGLEKQEAALRADLAANHDKIAKLMAALQRMGRNPPPVLFTQRQDALQMVRSAMLLAYAFPELRGDALGLASKLNTLINVVEGIRADREAARAETVYLADTRVRLSAQIEAKKQSALEKQTEIETLRGTAAVLSKSVTDLNELISKLDQAVTNGTNLGAYNAEIAATAPKAETPAPPSGDKQVAMNLPPPVAPSKPPMVELKPASFPGAGGRLDRFKPEFPFAQGKARLPMPAHGHLVVAFGDKTQFGGQSKGIGIETRAAAQITSPCDGWVVYAGEFRSYGPLLIINAGDGYHVLLTGLSQIDVQPGQFVLAAEPVGTMSGSAAVAPTNTASSKTQGNSPVLYVEFRKDGRPIDPDPWWVDGHQKVQG